MRTVSYTHLDVYKRQGAGVAKLKLGNYEEAITYFNDALKCDKVGKALKKDILSYRAVAYLKVKDYEAALAVSYTHLQEKAGRIILHTEKKVSQKVLLKDIWN